MCGDINRLANLKRRQQWSHREPGKSTPSIVMTARVVSSNGLRPEHAVTESTTQIGQTTRLTRINYANRRSPQ